MRVALAETQLVRETRDFLISNGVHIDAFSQPASKRSDTIIIVKNLPANTDVDELKRMFGRYGLLNRVLMPPGSYVFPALNSQILRFFVLLYCSSNGSIGLLLKAA